MEATGLVLVMLLAVVASLFLARLSRWPAPFLQIALGSAIYASGLASVELDPDVFFLLLLPPLLFLDGWRIPKDELMREAPTVLTLALGLVVFTVLGAGLLVHALIPAMPLPVAFALAAVIAPTDPVAVKAIAARTAIPTRMMRILEGESLFNDASGLVCMRLAVAAMLTGSFVLSSAVLSFLRLGLGGLAIGAGLTWLLTRARQGSVSLIGDDGGAQILITLLIPFGVYLLAERLHCSGILAAVAAGITMGYAPHSHWQAITRIRRTAVWETVQLAANGTIFVLLGEQLPSIFRAAPETVRLSGHENAAWLVLYAVAIVAALASLRFVWVWVSLRLAFFGRRLRGEPAARPNWRLVLAMSLAGVRGVITLAGVLTLPLKLHDGRPFPARDLAIVLAAGVILLSLLLATLALPRTLRGLSLPADPALRRAEYTVRSAAAQAAIKAILAAGRAAPASAAQSEASADLSRELIAVYRQRIERYDHDETSIADRRKADLIERELRLIGLRAEREEILRASAEHGVTELVQRRLVREIDLQEARYSS